MDLTKEEEQEGREDLWDWQSLNERQMEEWKEEEEMQVY